MMTETAAKKDTQKLQRAIVDGLEDVKAQAIEVYNTEHLTALFERVIIASGASNRQTKALAASVRDAVREAGFAKPRIEGEENGEWIIVDCGQAVVHIMQPNIRQYYHLEDLWGEKPVRLKFGTDKPPRVTASVVEKSSNKATPATPPLTSLKRSNAAKKGVAQAFPSKAQVKKDAEKLAASRAPAKKAPARKAAAKPASPAPMKMVKVEPKKLVAKKAAAKKSPVSSAAKPARKKPVARKAK
jgi:ribosome-associated protein